MMMKRNKKKLEMVLEGTRGVAVMMVFCIIALGTGIDMTPVANGIAIGVCILIMGVCYVVFRIADSLLVGRHFKEDYEESFLG